MAPRFPLAQVAGLRCPVLGVALPRWSILHRASHRTGPNWSISMTQYQSIVEQIETYKRPTRTGKTAILAMFVLGGGFGIGAGFLGVLVSGWLGFYVQIITPVVVGFAAGAAVGLGMVFFGPAGRRWLFSLAAITSGVVGYFALLFFTSRTIDPVDPLGLMGYMLTVPERTFIGLTVPLWLWWTFEGLIAVGVAWFIAFIAWFFDPEPLCGECGEACHERLRFSIAREHTRDALQALADKDYERLKALQSAVRTGARLEAYLYRCLHPTHDAYLSLNAITPGRVEEGEGGAGPDGLELVRFAVVSGAGATLLIRDFPPRTGALATATSAGVEVEEDREELPARSFDAEALTVTDDPPAEALIVTEDPPLEPPEPQTANRGVEIYKPTDQTTTLRVIFVILGGVVAGCVAVFLLHLLSRWIGFYIPVLFPGLIGLAVFLGGIIGEGEGRVERRWVWWSVAVIAGCTSYAAMALFRGPGIDFGDLGNNFRYFALAAGTWEKTFFVLSVPLGAKWVVESAIVVLIAGSFLTGTQGDPYCLECKELCKGRRLFTTTNRLAGNVINSLGDSDYHMMRRVAAAAPDENGELKVEIHHCKDLSHNAYLTLTSVKSKAEGDDAKEEELVRFGVVRGEDVRTLVEAFPEKK